VWGGPDDGPEDAPWKPWTDTWDPSAAGLFRGYDFGNNETFISYAQPMLSDITFGDDGSMSLGVRDRFGDQTGYRSGPPTLGDPDLFSASGAGETLRACLVAGTYQIENAGTCDGQGPGSAGTISNLGSGNQGPGGSEFYNHDYHTNNDGSLIGEEETSLGGLTQVPGFTEVATTIYDPLPIGSAASWTGGIRRFNTQTAADNGSYQLYGDSGVNDIFGKANGLGDLEVICQTAPVEVGNRIWKDTNANGVQDPEESPIAGVTVNLYSPSNVLIGTAVTDANGNYLFSNRSTDENGSNISDSTGKDYNVTGLIPNTNGYTIKLDNLADYTDPAKLQGLWLSPKDATADNGNNQNDSDASLAVAGMPSTTNIPTVTFDLAATGYNNHTYDIGFSPVDPATVNNGGGTTNPTSNQNDSGGSLAQTGQAMLGALLAGVLLLGTGGALILRYMRQRRMRFGNRGQLKLNKHEK
jgi:hypothetical protein